MSLRLVNEDEHGAYKGVCPDFLKRFAPIEVNPNFEVYDSFDGHNRFIVVKSSRVPDDENLIESTFGIDFNRAKPTLQQALDYRGGLPRGYKWLGEIAFAAQNEEEFEKKSFVWDKFYSYIWNSEPQTVWVAPHSGSVERLPDETIQFPKLMIDNNTAGIAARCAFLNTNKATKRIMMSIHSTGQLGAVLNLGDFGVVEEERLDIVARKMETKYHERVQVLADEFKQDFHDKTYKILENISKKRGTLDPEKLNRVSHDDGFTVATYVKCMKLYGQDIKEYTVSGFSKALRNLGKIDVPVILNNQIYPARNVGRILKLTEKMAQGLLHSALNVEGARLYLATDPKLVAGIILDVKNELFN